MDKFATGFRFKPTFLSSINYFEVREVVGDIVKTMVYPKEGSPFPDEIEKDYYEGAFVIGDYVAL